jgi:hypothetical protein
MRRVALLGFVSTLMAMGGSVLAFTGVASAASSVTVSPNSGLSNGSSVTVNGSGFTPGPGALVECNTTSPQPTVSFLGAAQIPVSCSVPEIVTTPASGVLPTSSFTVHTGVVGPPATGTDTDGNPAATDAQKYPCPPTQAQINEGFSCTIGYGTSATDAATANISFTGQPTPQSVVSSLSPNAGPITGGTSVTITGLNLSGATAVHFGSVAATSFANVSATSVTAVSPAVASGATVPVVVTTPLGASVAGSTGSNNFTYTLAPIVNSISPISGPSGGGTVVSITGLQFTGSTAVDFGSVPATSFTVNSDTSITATSPTGSGTVDVTVTNAHGVSPTSAADLFTYQGGYRLVASDGGVFTYGPLAFEGSAGGMKLNKPIVGMATTSDGDGYWLVASDGGVFSYGDAQFFGSAGSLTLNKPIVGIAATSDDGGYSLVASDGGVFTYGDAGFFGSAGSLTLNKPVVGIAATPDDGGYWLVASDGGIFAYGDATFDGSAGSLTLNAPIVGMSAAG